MSHDKFEIQASNGKYSTKNSKEEIDQESKYSSSSFFALLRFMSSSFFNAHCIDLSVYVYVNCSMLIRVAENFQKKIIKVLNQRKSKCLPAHHERKTDKQTE